MEIKQKDRENTAHTTQGGDADASLKEQNFQ